MPDLTPATLQPILAHLLHWGELSSAEARWLKAEAGLALLASGNLVQDAPDSWMIGPGLARLLPIENLEEAWQKACWSLSAYQAYLTALAAGEIARHGLEGAGELVEQWIATVLPHQAPAFNTFLDQIEQNDLHTPLSESTPGALVQAVQHSLHELEQEAGLDFAVWNQALLGVSAPDEAVFQASLARGALADQPVIPVTQEVVAPTAIQDLNAELFTPTGRLVFFPALNNPNPLQNPGLIYDPAWRKRRYVLSSIPLLDDGEDRMALTQVPVQAAFCQHPISWIIIQLGLQQHIQSRAGAADQALRLAFEREPAGVIQDLRIELPDGGVRYLSEKLPQLVACLGMRLMLPFGVISPEALGSWLEALLQVGILEARSDGVVLGQDFSRVAFESKYYQTLVKTAKPWRMRLIEYMQCE